MGQKLSNPKIVFRYYKADADNLWDRVRDHVDKKIRENKFYMNDSHARELYREVMETMNISFYEYKILSSSRAMYANFREYIEYMRERSPNIQKTDSPKTLHIQDQTSYSLHQNLLSQ